MRVRRATTADAGSVRGLVAAFRDHVGAADPSDASLADGVPRLLADSGIEFFCAFEPDDRAVGYTQTVFFPSLWAEGTEALLVDIFVVEAARGRGLGRTLLDAALDGAASRNARLMGLYTNENNVASQALYRAAGFELQSDPLWNGGREVRWIRKI